MVRLGTAISRMEVVWLSMPRRSYCLPSSHGLEVDDKLNLFGHLDRADTEDAANVNDADAAQLDKVADNLGRRTDERLVGYTA